MAAHGKFYLQKEDWISYSEWLQASFAANEIEDGDKKKAILLSVVSAETYQLMQSLVAPEKSAVKGFDALVKLVQDHYQSTLSVIVQSLKFNSRTHRSGESTTTFVAELWKLAEHCKFQATLNNMLRDRLVCGVTNGHLQHHLLTEPELTLKDTVKIAIAQETAGKGTQ